jgi:hypothetical protein
VLLAFTRARPDRPYHRRDLFNVCCEHPGARIQFGYDKKWVPDTVLTTKFLKSEPVLVVYCELPDHDIRRYHYHPLRFATLSSSHVGLDHVNLLLELGGFVGDSASGEYPAGKLPDFQKHVAANKENPIPLEPGAPPRFLRRDTSDFKLGALGGWDSLVEHFGKLEGLSEGIFFRVLSEDSLKERGIRRLPKPASSGARQVIHLNSGRVYQTAAQVFVGAHAGQRDPELVLSGDGGTVSGPFSRQSGQGIESTFVVTIKRSLEFLTTLLVWKIPRGPTDPVNAPEFQILLRAQPPYLSAFIAALFVVVGTFLVSLGHDEVKELLSCSTQARPHISFWCANAELVASIAKGLGLAMVFAGSIIGFRKLPIDK